MKKFILAIDEGTTGSTALLINAENFQLVDSVNSEFKQHFPKPSWVEHDLSEIWLSIEKTVKEVLKKNNISGEQICSIGITNQRETTCAYNNAGEPLAKAIVWQDRRTSEFCQSAKEKYAPLIKKTGLPLDPYFSGTKMRWLLENNDNVASAAKNNELHFSTIDSFILFKMTAGQSFKTEASNASRTLLMDLDSCEWDKELCSFFDIDKKYLPEICDSFTEFGSTKGLSFLPDGIPITCILGDQQAALFGQAGFNAGDMKCTYGTGAFILLNTGTEKVYSEKGLLTTVAFKHKGEALYALEGSCYIAGAAVQWLRDNLSLIETSPEVEKLASDVTDLGEMENLLFLPFFTGIGSPHWVSDAKAAIIGITRDTSKKHIARACLEGMAMAIDDSMGEIIKNSPTKVESIKVDGGASQNNLLLQLQANFSQMDIVRPKVIETTAYGVAVGSLIGLGKITFKDIENLWQEDKTFKAKSDEYFVKKSAQWVNTVKKLYLA